MYLCSAGSLPGNEHEAAWEESILSPHYAPALSYYIRTGLLEMVSIAGGLLSKWADEMASGTGMEQPGPSSFSPTGLSLHERCPLKSSPPAWGTACPCLGKTFNSEYKGHYEFTWSFSAIWLRALSVHLEATALQARQQRMASLS